MSLVSRFGSRYGNYGPTRKSRTLTHWQGATTRGSAVSQPCHMTRGTRRTQEDMKGHDERGDCVQEDLGGNVSAGVKLPR